MSSVACHHIPLSIYTVGRHEEWHVIIVVEQHTRALNVGRCMLSLPLDMTHRQTTSGMARNHGSGQHTQSDDIRCGNHAYLLYNTHIQTMSSVACHHSSGTTRTKRWCRAWLSHYSHWTTHNVRWREEWHAIIALILHTRINDDGRGFPSSPLDSTHDQTKLVVACLRSPSTAKIITRIRVWHGIIALRKHSRLNDVGREMSL